LALPLPNTDCTEPFAIAAAGSEERQAPINRQPDILPERIVAALVQSMLSAIITVSRCVLDPARFGQRALATKSRRKFAAQHIAKWRMPDEVPTLARIPGSASRAGNS
jgi:hypothetical protein